MAGNGPAPSPNARRRNVRPAFRRLPLAGRRGDPPAFPLARSTAAERALWAELWASPQACAWEELGWIRTVARYTRIAIMAERRTAHGYVLTEARQLEDRLGLNPRAMRSLGWEITGDAAESTSEASDVVDLDAFRSRLG